MDKNTITPERKTVKSLFDGDASFIRIPKYQRPFSWNKDNAEKFYSDVFKETIFKDKKDYFIGSILLNRINNDLVEVVDGQQRITTISLFFIALYLLYKNTNSSNSDSSDILKFLKKGSFNKKTNILTLSKSNINFYNQLLDINSIDELNEVDIKNENVSNKNIMAILKFFIAEINKNKNSDVNLENKRIEEIYEHICNHLFFITITAENSKQASKLFEVLNNRGIDLTEADLIRNYLLSKSDEQNFTDGFKTWENFEKTIGLDNLEQFLRYSSFLVSKKDNIYERITEFTDNGSSKTTLDFLMDLSSFYLQILSPNEYNEIEEGEIFLEDLNILGITQARSILLAAYKKYDKDKILDLLNYLVNFTFRYSSICGLNPNKLEDKYAEIAFDIYKNQKSLEEIKLELQKLNPNVEQFKLAFLNKEFKNTKIPRYTLKKIEDKISSGEKPVDLDSVHLEHIMPKKIDKWLIGDVNFKQETYAKYLNNIGNMVLLSEKINTVIKNSLFNIKKGRYGGSEINLISEIKIKNKWTEEEILWNAERYYEIAKDIWV